MLEQFEENGKENEGKRDRKKGKRNEKKGRIREEDRLLPPFFQCLTDQRASFVHDLRSRCFLLLWLFLLKGHSMTIMFSPNNRASPKIVSTKLLIV